MLVDLNRLDQFVKAISPMTRGGFDPWALLTHAWHESAGFTKPIFRFNLWGIKPPYKWRRMKEPPIPIANLWTWEYVNGKRQRLLEPWLAFRSMDEAVGYYKDLVFRLYDPAVDQRFSVPGFFRGLVLGDFKWATDPKYVDKMVKLYEVLTKNESVHHLLVDRVNEFSHVESAVRKHFKNKS